MRVAAGVFAGALVFLLLSFAGVDPEVGRPRQQSLVVMLGSRTDASSSAVTASPQTVPAYQADGPVETVVPDIEHYEGVGDYYRDENVVDHGAGQLDDEDEEGDDEEGDDEEGDEDEVADEQSDVDDIDDIDDLGDAEEKRGSPHGKAEGHGGG